MGNLIDISIIVFAVYLIWQGLRTGFVGGILNLLTTVISFLLGTFLYPYVGSFLSQTFKVNENFALVAGFFLVLIFCEVVFSLLLGYFYSHFVKLYKKSALVAKIDRYLGVVPSLVTGLFLVSLLMLLILTLPVKPWLREPIQDSWWGKNVVVRGSSFVPTVEKWLNKTPYKNLVYLVTPISPNSKESQNLNIPANIKTAPDPVSEKEMFDLINKERIKAGQRPIGFDNALRDVGRAHCVDMFKRNYFSHYTPEGKDPFQRMDDAGIVYVTAGENLAYAPSVAIAHEGLMNSPGHKANILRQSFGRVGVGVIDGGVYGKMFCQEFTN